MSDSYDLVADVIGKAMDEAWIKIMTNLASADIGTLSASGMNVTAVQLQEFFANLGGCQLGIRFSSIKPKGETVRFNAQQLQPSTAISTLGVSGSISIGVNISF